MVATNRSAVARPSDGLWSLEDGVQPLRPMVEERPMDEVVRRGARRRRQRMALHRQHDEPGASTRRRWKRGAQIHAIGRSRGGATTKVHLVVDALGLPLSFRITEGQRHDIVPAPELVRETKPRCLLGDKAYSTVAFRAELAELGCVPVIPSSSSWIKPPKYDRDWYKSRSEIECTINLLKHARRFATRYEKTLRNYVAVVALGCLLLWLRI